MILIDVNILVEAHREDAGHHAKIRKWVEACLASPREWRSPNWV